MIIVIKVILITIIIGNSRYRSSLRSPQSLCPSWRKLSAMHLPLAHANCPSWHVLAVLFSGREGCIAVRWQDKNDKEARLARLQSKAILAEKVNSWHTIEISKNITNMNLNIKLWYIIAVFRERVAVETLSLPENHYMVIKLGACNFYCVFPGTRLNRMYHCKCCVTISFIIHHDKIKMARKSEKIWKENTSGFTGEGKRWKVW